MRHICRILAPVAGFGAGVRTVAGSSAQVGQNFSRIARYGPCVPKMVSGRDHHLITNA
jgi:hypothetical protein